MLQRPLYLGGVIVLAAQPETTRASERHRSHPGTEPRFVVRMPVNAVGAVAIVVREATVESELGLFFNALLNRDQAGRHAGSCPDYASAEGIVTSSPPGLKAGDRGPLTGHDGLELVQFEALRESCWVPIVALEEAAIDLDRSPSPFSEEIHGLEKRPTHAASSGSADAAEAPPWPSVWIPLHEQQNRQRSPDALGGLQALQRCSHVGSSWDPRARCAPRRFPLRYWRFFRRRLLTGQPGAESRPQRQERASTGPAAPAAEADR